MSTKPHPKVSPFRCHKASGRGYVNLNGRRVCLGRFDQPEARANYDKVITEWLANGRQRRVDSTGLTVNELAIRFWCYVESYYRKPDGTPTKEVK